MVLHFLLEPLLVRRSHCLIRIPLLINRRLRGQFQVGLLRRNRRYKLLRINKNQLLQLQILLLLLLQLLQLIMQSLDQEISSTKKTIRHHPLQQICSITIIIQIHQVISVKVAQQQPKYSVNKPNHKQTITVTYSIILHRIQSLKVINFQDMLQLLLGVEIVS